MFAASCRVFTALFNGAQIRRRDAADDVVAPAPSSCAAGLQRRPRGGGLLLLHGARRDLGGAGGASSSPCQWRLAPAQGGRSTASARRSRGGCASSPQPPPRRFSATLPTAPSPGDVRLARRSLVSSSGSSRAAPSPTPRPCDPRRATRAIRRNSAAQFGAILRRPAFRLHQPAVLLLLVLLTAQLIRAVVHATVAGTVGSWYFLSPRVPPTDGARARARSPPRSARSASARSSPPRCRRPHRRARPSSRGGGRLRSCCLCLLGFIDVLVRFFNEFAYTQIALYGKNFTRVARHVDPLVHHRASTPSCRRTLWVGDAGPLVGGMFTCLLVERGARRSASTAPRGGRRAPPPPHRTARTSHAHTPIRRCSSLAPRRVLGAVRSAPSSRRAPLPLRLLCRGSEPAADARLDAVRNLHRAPARAAAGDGGVLRQHGGGGIAIGRDERVQQRVSVCRVWSCGEPWIEYKKCVEMRVCTARAQGSR